MSVQPEKIEIQSVLAGCRRVKDMNVAPDNHQYIVLSHLYAWMEKYALPEASDVMLDYGCGAQPYKSFFSSRTTKYIGADVAAAEGVNLDIQFLPDRPLPLPDESIDTILSTQVLEHVRDVNFYLRECRRLLKPGGKLILTAPMQWRHHECPFDFLRFTKYGLIEFLSQNGFAIKQLSSCGGVYALLGQIFLNHLDERGVRNRLLFRFINRLTLWLDRKFNDTEDTINWMCIASKAEQEVLQDADRTPKGDSYDF